jgi:hypothetical protein
VAQNKRQLEWPDVAQFGPEQRGTNAARLEPQVLTPRLEADCQNRIGDRAGEEGGWVGYWPMRPSIRSRNRST